MDTEHIGITKAASDGLVSRGRPAHGSWQLERHHGSQFARAGVVLISLNYRLGPFGFFAHPALSAESHNEPVTNFGILDSVAALRWVKHNVAQFGGDPGNVTIFGESAGGVLVNLLMVSPLSKGLFHRAISQSGPKSPRRLHIVNSFTVS